MKEDASSAADTTDQSDANLDHEAMEARSREIQTLIWRMFNLARRPFEGRPSFAAWRRGKYVDGWLILAWPPSSNRVWRVREGRLVLSKQARRFQEMFRPDKEQSKKEPFTGPVIVRLFACPPDNRRRDLDNVIDPVLDALKGIAFADDSQIVGLSIERGPACPANDEPRGFILADIFEAASTYWPDANEALSVSWPPNWDNIPRKGGPKRGFRLFRWLRRD